MQLELWIKTMVDRSSQFLELNWNWWNGCGECFMGTAFWNQQPSISASLDLRIPVPPWSDLWTEINDSCISWANIATNHRHAWKKLPKHNTLCGSVKLRWFNGVGCLMKGMVLIWHKRGRTTGITVQYMVLVMNGRREQVFIGSLLRLSNLLSPRQKVN